MTLNELARERRKYLVEVARRWRTLDTGVERGQRRLARILSRKNKVPEVTDLKNLDTDLTAVLQAVQAVNSLIDKGFVA